MKRFVMGTKGDMNGEGVKKKVKFLTNAEMIAGRIARKCVGGRQQTQWLRKQFKPSEVYPEDWCKDVLRGLRGQMEVDGRLNNTGVGCVFAMEEGETELVFYDDVSGELLDWDRVVEARAEKVERQH